MIIALVVCGVGGLIEYMIYDTFNEVLHPSQFLILLQTNLTEAKEFLSEYVKISAIIYLFIVVCLFYLLYYLLDKYIRPLVTRPIAYMGLVLTLICTVFGWNFIPYSGVMYVVTVMRSSEGIEVYNLAESEARYDVKVLNDSCPNVILILGESFDKQHSSLYGYDKLTNPLLGKRVTDGTMVVFKNVKSSAPITHKSLRQMFSLSETLNDSLWHHKPLLISALRKSGYKTFWLSNQPGTSLYDNSQIQLAELSDSSFFTVNQLNSRNQSHDEVLLKPFKDYIDKYDFEKPLYVTVHLTGSHFQYSKRYPPKFKKFSEGDYLSRPENQREKLSTYDNSLLYNDFVVDSLLRIADKIDAIVIYLSDHGQNLFYTNPNIAGHGSENDKASFEAATHIPFLIYATPKFRAKHPEFLENIRKFTTDSFETKYYMNTILDMLSIRINGYDTEKQSLFKGQKVINSHKNR